ncbi:ABC transporter permease [Mycolicibacterium sarraceniae]|uniref:Transport permease protein n=1 Tax=Mycolicibacterium sarraceniae TaxID=1534348 RepID=A0A7I7SP87_9MYCO|nr:ABC transporter permease [Mycolicibacterium sarraceniae]BBY58824.1 transport permease protein [Mycolicibacterium sarraceniae]
MTAITALTERIVHTAVRDFDLALGILVPVGTLFGLNGALRYVIDTGEMSYAEYLAPAVIVQAMLLGAVTTADRAGREQASGLTARLRTQPISRLAPMIARMLYCLLRGILSLAAALATGYLLGFRLSGGVIYTAAFVAIPLCLTLALSLGADATGTSLRRIGGSQLLLLPQLILILVSTGLAPAKAFPDWVQPFVRYQPVSQVTDTIRGLAVGRIAGGHVAITAAWCVGLLVIFGLIAIRMQRRPI